MSTEQSAQPSPSVEPPESTVARGEAAAGVRLDAVDLPVSARVPRPDARLPRDRGGLRWRPATLADLEALHALDGRVASVDHPLHVTSLSSMRQLLEMPGIDLERDSLVADEGDGQLVAWGLSFLWPVRESVVRVSVDGGVDPRRRRQGLGRDLVEWQRLRGEQHLSASDDVLPAVLAAGVEQEAKSHAALLERQGFGPARWWSTLSRDLTRPVEPVPLDPAVRLEDYSTHREEATRLARNEAFVDHWGSQASTPEVWRMLVGAATFRPDLSFVAVAAGDDGEEEVVAFVLTTVEPEQWPAHGGRSAHVDYVGVRRAWRGRHLAQSLLATALARQADQGFELCVLDVDSTSPTGAVGLYDRAGFTVAGRRAAYLREY
ncbi:GNAT family N-acetyltransferase [Frigoribacterium sp. CFBP 8766]|uniref:GNAT family N-acetyltransferase n=1 Tax=Frigoribacterium sp. CFBP 8766 TaxID=2775273 RepID=UPI00177CA453|nr:GNAT family N-acetyltransferase [Frigoribacterium sp. CFBP 8766]MBD8583253.1 GNAT family N-acetyltransferase [Frigoribacterium sp. CFBP 8766]